MAEITITISAGSSKDLQRTLVDLLSGTQQVTADAAPLKQDPPQLHAVETAEPEFEAVPDDPKAIAADAAARQAALEAAEEKPPIEGERGESELDVDALRLRFEGLVTKDYDQAADMLDTLGVENFTQAIGAEKGPKLAELLGAVDWKALEDKGAA